MKAGAPHYKAYVARPFFPAERDDVEILFGGLHWRAERVIQAVLENLGYRARPLPPAARADLLLGRELADVGQCCPTSFVTGNLAQFLKSGTVADRRRGRRKELHLSHGWGLRGLPVRPISSEL